MRYLVPGFFLSDSVIELARSEQLSSATHSCCGDSCPSTRSQTSMNCTIGNHGPEKSSLLFLPGIYLISHTKAWHMSFSILLDSPSLPLYLYLIFLLSLCPVTIQHLKSYAAMPSCLHEHSSGCCITIICLTPWLHIPRDSA